MTDVTNTPVDQPTTTPAPSIELADLQNAIKVIDHACQAGAFRGWAVIEQVIAVREKIATFLKAATPPEPVEEAKPKAKAKTKTVAKK